MRELKLTRLVRLAVVPALALGVSLSTQAQNTTSQNNPATAGTPSAAKAGTNKNAAAPAYRALRASAMIGKEVRNPEGKNIGKINDLIVDMTTGDVRYSILEFDPGIFQGERLFAVPTNQLRMAADRDDLVYNMTRDRLENAGVNRADWDKTWRDPNYLANLDKAWGVTPAVRSGVTQPTRGAMAHRVSDLIGKDVNGRTGQKIGAIEDIVVNMATQKVHYAVLEFDPSLAAPNEYYAFPLRAFNLTANRDELVLDVDKAKIQAMKSFPAARLANLNDRVLIADIDRYLVTILPASTAPANANRTAAMTPATLFTQLDDDKNGSLDKTEVKDSADVDRNWTRFDKNNDGRISRDEFTSNYTIEPKRNGQQAAK